MLQADWTFTLLIHDTRHDGLYARLIQERNVYSLNELKNVLVVKREVELSQDRKIPLLE